MDKPATAPVVVGTSPAGVIWTVYPDRFACADAMNRAIATQTANLARMWQRHNESKSIVRRVPITPRQSDRIEDMLTTREDGSASDFSVRRTYIEGPSVALEGLAKEIDCHEAAALAETGDAATEEQVLFARRSGYASALSLRSKLEGNRITPRSARAAAVRAVY